MPGKELEPETLCLYVDVPVCAFRPNWSREYQDTYPFPPPSTVFGMLLSLSGIDWHEKEKYRGIKLALAIEGEPERSRIFRKFRRIPQSNKKADPLGSRRPDYQELLLWLNLWIWLQDGNSEKSIIERVKMALDKYFRHQITRYGGLSLGESSHLVNEISIKEPVGEGRFLSLDNEGYYQFPVWVSHPRDEIDKTKRQRFSILKQGLLEMPSPNSSCWVKIT